MAEVSITKWLDPALKYFADQAGIPVDQYSAQVGGEGIGVALETVADFFTKGWLNKGVQFLAGLIADGYAIWGKGVPTRLRRELLALGTHELLRFVDPKPSDILEVRRSVETSINAVRRGDWNAFFSSILRSPTELQAMLGVVGVPVPAPAPAPARSYPVSTGGGRYTVKPKTALPSPQAPAPSPPPPPSRPPESEKRYKVAKTESAGKTEAHAKTRRYEVTQ